jgi:hypothetical protein
LNRLSGAGCQRAGCWESCRLLHVGPDPEPHIVSLRRNSFNAGKWLKERHRFKTSAVVSHKLHSLHTPSVDSIVRRIMERFQVSASLGNDPQAPSSMSPCQRESLSLLSWHLTRGLRNGSGDPEAMPRIRAIPSHQQPGHNATARLSGSIQGSLLIQLPSLSHRSASLFISPLLSR